MSRRRLAREASSERWIRREDLVRCLSSWGSLGIHSVVVRDESAVKRYVDRRRSLRRSWPRADANRLVCNAACL